MWLPELSGQNLSDGHTSGTPPHNCYDVVKEEMVVGSNEEMNVVYAINPRQLSERASASGTRPLSITHFVNSPRTQSDEWGGMEGWREAGGHATIWSKTVTHPLDSFAMQPQKSHCF